MIAILVAVFFVTFYIYGTRNFNYWKKRGIKHDTPILLFGTNAKNYIFQQSMSQVANDIYWRYPKEKVVGLFRSMRPVLVIRDPDIVKRILVTDFAYFYPRGLIPYKSSELLLHNLLFEDGDLWRLLRQSISPAFTSSKLRAMFPLVVEHAERLRSHIHIYAQEMPLDARDLMARYTTDVIGTIGFGLDTNTVNNEHSILRTLGLSIFRPQLKNSILLVLKDIFPGLFAHFKYLGRVEQTLCNLVSEILKHRNHKPSGTNDFIDLMLECQARGKMVGDSLEKENKNDNLKLISMELSDELIVAQVFSFFAAGYETASSTTSFTLHQLAYHPNVQQKVQMEIDQVLARYDNKLSYDAIKEMTYLECTIKESLRILPPVGILMRKCAKAYTIPESGVTIDKGVGVIIPLQGLHHDPQYFAEPQQFQPERFLPGVAGEINKHVYLPFGDGPRACIGMRLGMMQSVAGLAAVLSHFTVSPAKTAVRHPVLEPTSNVVQNFKDGLPLMFHKRC